MKKSILIPVVAFIVCFTQGVDAQINFYKKITSPSSMFTIRSSQMVSDGGFIACGSESNFSVLLKGDASGNIVWSKTIDFGTYVTPVATGECVGGGYYFLGTSAGWASYDLVKVDVTGNLLWAKEFSFSESQYSYPKIFIQSNGNFVISVSLQSLAGILTLDGNGNYLWGQLYGDDPKCPGFAGVSCSDGGYMLTGKDNSDILLIKMTANGTTQWASRLQDSMLYTQTRTILQTQDGNYLLAGLRMSSNYCGFVMKIDGNGSILWHKEYLMTGPMSGFDMYYFENAVELSNGDIVLSNEKSYYYNSYITRIDKNGNPLFTKQIGVVDPLTGISTKNLNSLSLAGTGLLLSGVSEDTGVSDGFIMRTDATGNNFGCEVEDIPVQVTSIPYMSSVTPTYTKTSVSPPLSITPIISAYNLSTQDLCLTSVPEFENPVSMNVFPNPSSDGFFSLEFQDKANKDLVVYNQLGEKVTELTSSDSQVHLSIPNAKGIYMVQAQDAQGHSFSKKVIVE